MKLRFLIIIILLTQVMPAAFCQGKSKKELKEETKLEKQNQTEALIDSRVFIFVARYAYPTGSRQINLPANSNYVSFRPEMIEANMPYFGTAYTGIGYGGDSGLKFKGQPEIFKVERRKKGFLINATVKGTNDVFRLSLEVTNSGSASLSVISVNRSTITYQGEISSK